MNIACCRGSYLDTSIKSVDEQACRNVWRLSGIYHRKWLAGWLAPFRSLTETSELLFVWLILSWELLKILPLFPSLLFLPVAGVVGAPPKCLLLGRCFLPPAAEHVGWVSSQLLLPPVYSLLAETTPEVLGVCTPPPRLAHSQGLT